MRRATIRYVAADAGVSIGTASKALNGQGRLRPETRERVGEAARRLGFAPNPLAQALLAGCLEDIGRAAAEDLLSAIGGEQARGVRTVPCRLVVRASSAGA